MNQLVRGPNGEYGYWDPTTGLQEISKEEYEQFGKTRGERFRGAVGDALQDTAGAGVGLLDMVGGLLGNVTSPGIGRPGLGAEIGAQNDPRQQARGMVDAPMVNAGTAAAIGGEMLVPGAGTLSRASGAILGRSAGSRIGLRAGADAIEASAESAARRASINAARNADNAAAGNGPLLRGFLQADELDDLAAEFSSGRLYTPGDARTLRATTPAEMDQGNALRQTEELGRSNIAADRALGMGRSINGIRDNAEAIGTKVVMREMGDNTDELLTSTKLNELGREIAKPFEDAAKEAGAFKFTPADVNDLQEAAARAGADDANLVNRFVERMTSDMKATDAAAATQASAREMNNSVARQYRTQLGKEISNAANAGRFDRAQALGEIQDVLDTIVQRQVSSETSDALTEARKRYRTYKAVQRSTATTSAGGEINIRSFMNAYQRRNRGGRNSRSDERRDKFYRTMETLNYLTQRVEPSSGTAQRLLAGGAAQTAGGIAAAGAAGAAAMGLLE